jgi:cytidylate kinase
LSVGVCFVFLDGAGEKWTVGRDGEWLRHNLVGHGEYNYGARHMQIICVSRGSQSRGTDFAERLSAELGYACIGREELLEEATRRRIPIGKLETAIIKPHIYSEHLAVELDHYKALATCILCEKALKNNIVYHGRTGHLLLPSIDHILRIRVVSEMEYRINYVMRQLGLSRQKAKQYIEQVEDDRRKWVREFYGVEWDVFTLYDLVLNLSQMGVNNAASAVCAMAQLPEFQSSPASVEALKDLYLASRARLLLATNETTARLNVRNPELITDALRNLEGVREIVCTVAATNILWIQQAYSLDDSSYKSVRTVADHWDAAVELLRLQPDERIEEAAVPAVAPSNHVSWPESGVIEEREAFGDAGEGNMGKIYERLIGDGHAGGRRSISGSQKALLKSIDRSVNYRLVVFDNVFLDKDASARKRLVQEWSNFLSESLGTPVVTINEIAARYHVGVKQVVKTLVALALVVMTVYLVFHFDRQILSFFRQSDLQWRILATACIIIFIPLFALTYSSAARFFLKVLKMD